MGLLLCEQEFIIRFNQEEQAMEIYTAYPPMMRKLSECPEYTKVREDKMEGKVIAMVFKANKRLLLLRTKIPVRKEMTEEEKEKLSERLAKMRSKRKISLRNKKMTV